jgi:two-component system, OmpR family, phosphate regulon sensor histidine kinase PhoR
MIILLSLLLLITWVMAGWVVSQFIEQRRAMRALQQAVKERQPLSAEDMREGAGEDWQPLVRATDALLIELNALKQQRSSQITQLEATLGSLQEAVLIVDENNSILLANKALHGIFPDTKGIVGRRLERVLQHQDFLAYVEEVRAGQAEARREMAFGGGPSLRWVEVTGTTIPPLNVQNGRSAIFVLHDITRQKQLERVRKDFVANVSHELRTPLSVIKGYIETLVEGHTDMPLADRTRFLGIVERHTERLNSLLEDLLTLSRLESVNPGLHREPVNLNTLLANLVDDYRGRHAARAHVFRCELDESVPVLPLDPFRMTQVFENLLDNAIKYTPAGTRLTVSSRRRAEEVEIVVADNGPGIPAEDLPHLFERFYRVDKGRSRETGGTGLGLSIVKHIVQLHGGRIGVESTLGGGTTFTLRLPDRDPSLGVIKA